MRKPVVQQGDFRVDFGYNSLISFLQIWLWLQRKGKGLIMKIRVRKRQTRPTQVPLKDHFSCLCLERNDTEGKEMLKVTPKTGLGKQQAEPKCLTNRQQIELHTAYSESTHCNPNWFLCLTLLLTQVERFQVFMCTIGMVMMCRYVHK